MFVKTTPNLVKVKGTAGYDLTMTVEAVNNFTVPVGGKIDVEIESDWTVIAGITQCECEQFVDQDSVTPKRCV